MNSVKDLRQALRDEFRTLETESQFEARMLDQASARRSLHRAMDARRSMKDLQRDVSRSRKGLGGGLWEAKPNDAPRLMALLAALLAVAIVASLVVAAHALHPTSNVPAANRTTLRTEACLVGCEVAHQPAADPKAAEQCSHFIGGCEIWPSTPRFTSSTIGWVTTSSTSYAAGSRSLYRSDDGGEHWRPVLSWDGGRAQLIRSSADGAEALIVTDWSAPAPRPTLFYTSDGGARWTASGLPIGADSGSAIYFLSPYEGWVLTTHLDLIHTTDAGVHWTRIGRLDRTGVNQTSLYFLNSNVGWYLPASATGSQSPLIYLTRDGGATWEGQTLQPARLRAGTAQMNIAIKIFNNGYGVLDATYCTSGLVSRPQGLTSFCGSPISEVAYITADGGKHWSAPAALPGARTIFIDSNHWIGMVAGPCDGFCPPINVPVQSLVHTNDGGRHWIPLAATPIGSNRSLTTPIDFVDPFHGWAVSNASLWTTSDGGTTWSISTFLQGAWDF